jgi:hypothetical protein
MAYIYGLCDPDTLELRYVGKAVDMPARMRGHRWEGRHTGTHKARWLRSIGEPIVVVLEDAGDRWAEAEQRWISDLRDMGARLTNITPGGDVGFKANHTEETKAKIRATVLRKGTRPPSRKGTKASSETRATLVAAVRARGARPPAMGGWNKGIPQSPEHREKNRQSHAGRPWSPARRAAQQRKVG